MKIILPCALILCFTWISSAQLAILNNESPQDMIMNTFAGDNVEISNVKINNYPTIANMVHPQFGRFYNGMTGIGMEDGIIISTGHATFAQGANGNAAMTSTVPFPNLGDPNLSIATNWATPVQSVGLLEFDFIPTGNTVLFEYVFASEEYPEFSNTAYNDVFGLFVNGPGISGSFVDNGINIATIPGTTLPVSINNLNNGQQNAGPCEHCEFYVHNGDGSTPLLNMELQYDGLTTVLTATGSVTPGQLHHIRIAVGNVGDNNLESAIFLKSGSFRSAVMLSTDEASVQKVRMYPNPADKFLHINANQQVSGVKISDLMGRLLRSVAVQSSDTEVDLSTFTSGTYIVTFNFADGTNESQKLVVR